MKKIFLFSLFVLSAFSMCSKPLSIEEDNPSSLFGTWKAKTTANPSADTVLVFSSNQYSYTISKKSGATIDIVIDTVYYERGNWKVTFVDYDNNDIYTESDGDNYLLTDALECSKPENIKRGTYMMFKQTRSGGRDFLEILVDKDKPLTTFEKVQQEEAE